MRKNLKNTFLSKEKRDDEEFEEYIPLKRAKR